MSKRESDGSLKNAAHNNAIGDGMTGGTVVGDNQLGDKPESQESLLKLFTGHGLKNKIFALFKLVKSRIFLNHLKTLKADFHIMRATGSSSI